MNGLTIKLRRYLYSPRTLFFRFHMHSSLPWGGGEHQANSSHLIKANLSCLPLKLMKSMKIWLYIIFFSLSYEISACLYAPQIGFKILVNYTISLLISILIKITHRDNNNDWYIILACMNNVHCGSTCMINP